MQDPYQRKDLTFAFQSVILSMLGLMSDLKTLRVPQKISENLKKRLDKGLRL